jgi:hypothetical protein
MQAVRIALEQLRMDGGGPLVAALAWTSGPGLATLFVLFPVFLLALLRRNRRASELRQGVG